MEAAAGNRPVYLSPIQEFSTRETIPFRVSPEPFRLSAEQKTQLKRIGLDIAAFFQAAGEMYQHDFRGVKQILDTGKPEIFLAGQMPEYLFVRPDLIITDSGFTVCEIETSPFGLALAEILNRAYLNEGFETLIACGTLPDHVREETPVEGLLVYSQKTKAYSGQMTFLAGEVFSGPGRNWQSEIADKVKDSEKLNIYRGFYLGEYLTDPAIKSLLESDAKLIPSATPFMEEKAVLSLVYDKRYEDYLRQKLGRPSFEHLRSLIPPTWTVGQEKYFSPGMPSNISSSVGLAGLARSKRTLVLKESGMGENSSWKKGVSFLHKQSRSKNLQALGKAEADKSNLYVVQEFRKGLNIPMPFESGNEDNPISMTARVRLTPYFSVINGHEGKLVAIKATGCENTDFIHATSTSINTAVS